LKSQISSLDKVIESSGLKTLSVDLKSKISILEKRFQEKKDDVETLKRNSTEVSKNVEALKTKVEKENPKQMESLEGKVSSLEKYVNNQIPKELTKLESMQKIVTENEKSVNSLKKSLDSSNQEFEKLNLKTVSKIDNLGNQLESGLKKTSESQNCLSDWLTQLSLKSEENERLNESFKKSLQSNGQDLLVLKEKVSQMISKTDFQLLEKNFHSKCDDKTKKLNDDLARMKTETSEQISFLETKFMKSTEDHGSNLKDLIDKSETNKSAIDEVIKQFEIQNLSSDKMDLRLTEDEKWMAELKTNLNGLISESDLIKLNFKRYQVTTWFSNKAS